MRNKRLVKQQHPKARAYRWADGCWTVNVPFFEGTHTLGGGTSAAQAWAAAAKCLQTRSSASVRAHVDKLISWHANLGQPSKSVSVSATANTVRKFARKRDGVYRYRDTIIVPIRPVRTRAEIAAERAGGDRNHSIHDIREASS